MPELAGSAASELDDLRVACDAAVDRLYDSGARSVVVLGADSCTTDLAAGYRGSFAPWGAALEVEVGRLPEGGVGTVHLPLSLLVGAWLLNRTAGSGPDPTCRMVTVAHDEPVERCAAAGARIGPNLPWALLVMGDGSACRGEKSPGYADARAQAYDDRVASALADADSAALLDLDPGLSAELKVAGRAPWQALAGAVRAAGGDWRGELTYYAAPYGVAYFVANWEPVR